MKQFTGKQKGTLGIVTAIIAAAVYLFGGIMGWWESVVKPDEPEKKVETPVAEAPVIPAPVKVEAKAEPVKVEAPAQDKKVVKKATKKKASKKAATKKTEKVEEVKK